MKYTFLILFSASVALLSCKDDATPENATERKNISPDLTLIPESESSAGIDSAKLTTVQWLDTLVDFGSVRSGESVDVRFRFRNTGDKPLLVQNVSSGCGCTVPEYTKEPVMPGKEGFIKAVFNSAGQPPTVHKTVSVIMNTRGTANHTLSFLGEVKH